MDEKVLGSLCIRWGVMISSKLSWLSRSSSMSEQVECSGDDICGILVCCWPGGDRKGDGEGTFLKTSELSVLWLVDSGSDASA